jgi:hypothetical protein
MAAKVQITYEAEASSLREVVNEANKANDALEAGAQKTSEKLSNTYKAVGKSFTSNFGGTQVRKTLDEQAKAFEQINKKATPLTRVLRGLKNELNQLEEEGKAGTAQFRQLTLEAARLEDQIGDTRARVSNLASDTFKFDAAVQATQGLAAGFEIAQGAAALFGSESEDLNKVIAKTTAVMAIANGVQQVAALLLDESKLKTLVLTQATTAYNAIVGTSTGALKAFRIALAATGVGLLVVAIGALIANFDKLKDAIFGTSNTSRALKATLEDVRSGLSGAIEETTKVGTAFELARAGVISKEEALLTYNETLGDTFGRTENLNEAEALYNAKTKAYLEATALRTRAQALFAESAALSAKAATITGEEATNTIESIQTFIGASIASFNQLIGGAATATAASFRASNAVTENNAKEREKKLLEAQAKEIQDLGVTELTKAEVIENGAKIASEAEQKVNAKRAERTKAANDKAAEAAKKAAEEQAAARQKLRDLENEAFLTQLAEQEKILNESNNKILELEKAFRDAKFKAGSAEEIQAQKDLATAIEQVKTQANKQIADLDKQELEKSVQRQIEAAKVGANATLQEQLTSIQKQQQIELDNAEKLGKDKVEINKRYGEQIDAINKQIAQAEVNTQINTLQRLEIEQGSSLDRRIQLIEIEAAKRKKEATDNIKDEKERASAIQLIEAQTQEAIREERKKTLDESIEQGLEFANAVGNAFQSFVALSKQQSEARVAFVQESSAAELEAINKSAASEITKERNREALRLRTERRIASEKTKQAALDKQLALFNAIINTAASITKVLGNPVLVALATAAGAVQIATIASQPVPRFAKGGLIGGRLHSAGGTLIEAERDEYIINRRQSVKHRRELDAINTSSAAFKKLIEERYVRPALLAYAGGRKNDAVIINASLNSKSMERKLDRLNKTMLKQKTVVNINAYDTRYKWQ